MPKIKSSPRKLKTLDGCKFDTPIKSPSKFKPGAMVIREISRYQKRTKPIIPAKQFVPALVQILNTDLQGKYEVTVPAVIAMQYALEDHITTVMRIAEDIASSNDRITVIPEDLKAAVEIDAKIREEKLQQFKEERKNLEIEYWKSLPEEERGTPSFKWEL
jgi:histone H3/H4